jgi:hypothetical protein
LSWQPASSLIISGIAADCATYRTFDGLKSYLIGAICVTFGAAGEGWAKMQGAHCFEMDIIIAGWSETRGADSYLLRTIKGTPTPAWTIVDTGNVMLAPGSDAIFREANEMLAGPRAPETIDDAELIRVAEVQREYREPYGPKRIMSSWVGGFLQVTTVTEYEISTRIIHRWESDQIGRRLNSKSRQAVAA